MLDRLKPSISNPFSGLFGGEEETESEPSLDYSRLKTPLPPDVIHQANEHAELTERDRSLLELLNGVQQYVDNHEYAERHGNAFYERLVEHFNDPDTLIDPVLIRDNELFFTLPAEYWAEIGEALNYNNRELQAVADAHQIYANEAGLAEYATTVRMMCVKVPQDRRLRDLIKLSGIEEEKIDLPASKYETSMEMEESTIKPPTTEAQREAEGVPESEIEQAESPEEVSKHSRRHERAEREESPMPRTAGEAVEPEEVEEAGAEAKAEAEEANIHEMFAEAEETEEIAGESPSERGGERGEEPSFSETFEFDSEAEGEGLEPDESPDEQTEDDEKQ